MIQGRLSEAEMRLVIEESRRQVGLPIHYAEREARDMRKLRSAIRRARQVMSDTETPLGLIVIDYIQQLTHPDARSIYDRASMASDFAKGIAMDFGVPVLALAQLSRQVENRDPPVPMLSDLRESGKIEEDADVVFFTYRDAYYLQRKLDALGNNDIEKEADLRAALDMCRNNIDLIIAKQRSGPTRTVQAYIRPELCQVSKDRAEYAGDLI
jgi:replicative DNA helicase